MEYEQATKEGDKQDLQAFTSNIMKILNTYIDEEGAVENMFKKNEDGGKFSKLIYISRYQ